MLSMIAMLAAVTVAAPVQANVAGKAQPAEEDRIVCKRVQETQWRTSKRKVCWPASKWRQIAQETQDAKTKYGSSGRYGTIQ